MQLTLNSYFVGLLEKIARQEGLSTDDAARAMLLLGLGIMDKMDDAMEEGSYVAVTPKETTKLFRHFRSKGD